MAGSKKSDEPQERRPRRLEQDRGRSPEARDAHGPHDPPRIEEVGLDDATAKIFEGATRRVSRQSLTDLIAETRDEDDVGPTRSVRPLKPVQPPPPPPASLPPLASPPPAASATSQPYVRQLAQQRTTALDAEGERFGPYTLLGAVGQGGMAEVRLAAEARPDQSVRLCVVKRVPRDAPRHHHAALIEEGRICRRLRHANIVELYDAGEIDRRAYLAFELVDGVSARELKKLLPRGLPLSAALDLGTQAMSALAHAHAATGDDGTPLRVVHRDVTPANILIERGGRVKLADFGIAKFSDRGLRTEMGLVSGKPGYLAPERLRGDPVDGRADVFSLGLTLIELISGQRVLPQRMMIVAQIEPVIRERLAGAPEPVPPLVAACLIRMAALDPAHRPTAGEALRELRQVLSLIEPRTPLAEVLGREVFPRLLPFDLRSLVEAPTKRVSLAEDDDEDTGEDASYATTVRVARLVAR